MSSRAPAPRSPERVDDRWQATPRRVASGQAEAGPHVGSVRLTPTRVTLALALAGSVLFLLYAVTVRDASQIPLLAAGALVLGLIFSALAIAGAIGAYRSAREDRAGVALGNALLGGFAALVAFGCLAVTVLLALVWRPPAA